MYIREKLHHIYVSGSRDYSLHTSHHRLCKNLINVIDVSIWTCTWTSISVKTCPPQLQRFVASLISTILAYESIDLNFIDLHGISFPCHIKCLQMYVKVLTLDYSHSCQYWASLAWKIQRNKRVCFVLAWLQSFTGSFTWSALENFTSWNCFAGFMANPYQRVIFVLREISKITFFEQ